MFRKQYLVNLVINEIFIRRVVIDPHYLQKHGGSIDDKIILKLVQQLDAQNFEPIDEKPPYFYFVNIVILNGKKYKIIWLLEENEVYIGIINTYRI